MNSITTDSLRTDPRDGGVVVVWIDVPGEKVNTLHEQFGAELEKILDALDREKSLTAIVLASGKPHGFIAGADVKMLRQVRSAAEGTKLSRDAQALTHRLAGFRVPVVAAIHGSCLGGGLELALACSGRVASSDDKTRLGLPEVNLGIIPGAGGTQRLPRLIGPEAALDIILAGKTVGARKALALGLVDEVVHPSILLDTALAHARNGGAPRDRGVFARVKAFVLEANPIGREILCSQARRRVLERTQGNMPAPERALEAVRIGLDAGEKRGYRAEAEAFGKLTVSPEAASLMGLFFAINEIKKEPFGEAREVQKVGVLGAGLMGSGIAYVTAAKADRPVRLKDVSHEALRNGLRSIHRALSGRVARRRMTRRDRDRVMALVRPTADYSGFRRAAIVIEAVVEKLEVKRTVLRDVEKHGGPETIFASNTSSLPIDRIAQGSAHPERVIGMHYFSPVDRLPLLEIIVGKKTASWVTATCVALGKAQGKTVIVVRDGPGFYTTRILSPYVNEAGHLVAEGVPVEEIDRALVRFGFPVGPLKLLDEVGIDTGHKIAEILREAFGDRMAPAAAMEKVVAAGRFGRKSGSGFYAYSGKKSRGVDPNVCDLIGTSPKKGSARRDLALRCVLTMVNEAAHCLSEGIVRSARDGDVGAVMGLGFPPFLGGPFRFVDARGAREIVDLLEGFRKRHGERFAPAPLLVEMAARREVFHGKASQESTRRENRK